MEIRKEEVENHQIEGRTPLPTLMEGRQTLVSGFAEHTIPVLPEYVVQQATGGGIILDDEKT